MSPKLGWGHGKGQWGVWVYKVSMRECGGRGGSVYRKEKSGGTGRDLEGTGGIWGRVWDGSEEKLFLILDSSTDQTQAQQIKQKAGGGTISVTLPRLPSPLWGGRLFLYGTDDPLQPPPLPQRGAEGRSQPPLPLFPPAHAPSPAFPPQFTSARRGRGRGIRTGGIEGSAGLRRSAEGSQPSPAHSQRKQPIGALCAPPPRPVDFLNASRCLPIGKELLVLPLLSFQPMGSEALLWAVESSTAKEFSPIWGRVHPTGRHHMRGRGLPEGI